MGVFDDRGETLRSLHLLATLLDLGYPLDAAVPLLSRLAETRALRATWERVHERLFEGHSLSGAMLSLRGEGPFPTALVALLEVGEMQGELSAALRAACGGEAFDVFRSKELPASTPPLALASALLRAPAPRLMAALLRAAIGAGAERLGLFSGSASAMLGPWELAHSPSDGVWPEDDPEALSDRAAVPPVPASRDIGPLDDLDLGQASVDGSAPLGPRFEPASLPRTDLLVGALRPDGWHELTRPSAPLFPRLARYCLYRARVPYWRRARASGMMGFELGSIRQHLPLEYAPEAEPASLVLDLRGVYRLSTPPP